MSTISASHRLQASGTKRKVRHLTNEDMNASQRTALPPEVIYIDEPNDQLADILGLALTNTTALDMASARMKVFVRMLRYSQQRAVFKDNAMRYIATFADFNRESKSLLKTKDKPNYCRPSCRITIPLQPTQRVKESTAFKALADESARIATEISLHMAAQVLKCKYLNNT